MGSPKQNQIPALLSPNLLLVSFLAEQPLQLVAGSGHPMLPTNIQSAKLLPVPYLQYYTY